MLSFVLRIHHKDLVSRLKTSVSIREAARILKIRPETLRRWIEDLGVIELGRQWPNTKIRALEICEER